MKCSKCGFDNPEEAIFCQKCDWKLGETYIPETKFNRSIICWLALILGIIAIIPIAMGSNYMVSVVFGALGLLFGGYAFNVPRLTDVNNKALLVAVSSIGLLLSIFSFIYGIYMLV